MRTRTRFGKLRTSGVGSGGIPLLGLCLLLVGCGGDAPTAAARPANELDVFLIAGQSNARGRGDRLLSPDVPTGVAFVWSVKDLALVEADDPVGDARTGSAWPAFALRYHAETGRRPVLIPTAVGGSAQHVSAATQYGHWDAGQSHYLAAVQKVWTALTELKRLGYTPVFRGVLWDQGGRDAQAIAAGSTTKDQYRSALEAMLARFRG